MNEDRRWLDRVLAYEDLTADERKEVDRELATRPEARELLERLRAMEGAGPRGNLALPNDELARLSASEHAEAERSLALLHKRVGRRWAQEPVSVFDRWRASMRKVFVPPAGGLGPFLLTRFAVPLVAAAGAWIVFAPAESPIGELEAFPIAAHRGAVDADEGRNRAGGWEWRAGDAFFLRCASQDPVVPVLFHVDPAGVVTQLHPEDGRWREVSGVLEFPESGSAEGWVLEKDGVETFVLAMRHEAPSDFAETETAIAALTGRSREETVRELTSILGESFDDVRITEIQH